MALKDNVLSRSPITAACWARTTERFQSGKIQVRSEQVGHPHGVHGDRQCSDGRAQRDGIRSGGARDCGNVYVCDGRHIYGDIRPGHL